MLVSLASRSGLIDDALHYWNRIRGDRSMPARADVNPADIPTILPYVMLIDVLRDPLDFQHRLLGTAVDRIFRRNYHGVKLSELSEKAAGNPIWDDYCRVVSERRPLRRPIVYVGPDEYVRQLEHCLMPLSADGDAVNMVFTVIEIDRKFS